MPGTSSTSPPATASRRLRRAARRRAPSRRPLLMDAFGAAPADRGGWPTGSPRAASSCWRPTSFTALAAHPWSTLAGPRGPDPRAGSSAGDRAAHGRLTPEADRARGAPTRGAGRGAATARSRSPATAWAPARLWIAAAYPHRVAALACFHAGGLVTDAPDSPHLQRLGQQRRALLRPRRQGPQHDPGANRRPRARPSTRPASRYRSELFAGAPHGYTMADTPAYDAAAAERHFTELFALLGRTVSVDRPDSGRRSDRRTRGPAVCVTPRCGRTCVLMLGA